LYSGIFLGGLIVNIKESEYNKKVLHLRGLNELKLMEIRNPQKRYKNKISNPRKNSNYLIHSGYGLYENGLNGSRRIYVKMSQHPILTTLTAISIGTMVLKVMKNSKK
jgi:hypothetical protein